jgi:hypothetical protein
MRKGDNSAYTEIQKRVNGERKQRKRKKTPEKRAWARVNRLAGDGKRRIEIGDGDPECLILQFGQMWSQR